MATARDSTAIASYICIAGDGLYDFLLNDLIPGFTASEILKWAVGVMDSPLSYKHCIVAEDTNNKQIAGAINIFPADLLRKGIGGLINTEHWRYLQPVLGYQDWGSLFINSLSVGNKWRQSGIGGCLLDQAYMHAQSNSFDRVSLHVWSDNLNAISFYKKRGFKIMNTVSLEGHPEFPNKLGSVLMHRHI